VRAKRLFGGSDSSERIRATMQRMSAALNEARNALDPLTGSVLVARCARCHICYQSDIHPCRCKIIT